VRNYNKVLFGKREEKGSLGRSGADSKITLNWS
jgi:hypothetical protein